MHIHLRPCLRWAFVGLTLFCSALSFSFAQESEQPPELAIDIFKFPPLEDFPKPDGRQYYNFTPLANDPFTESVIDLRHLNEEVAGQDGWVTHADGRFYLGNGEPVRFWSVNINANVPIAMIEGQGRFLAKKGINMVRVHGPRKTLGVGGPDLRAVNMTVVDELHRTAAAMKEHGIYTSISNTYFVITLDIQPEWGLPGYTQEWINANPELLQPTGLVFLDETFRSAFLHWLDVMMTTPNPYAEGNITLGEDTSVAIVEILNEDNLFFNSFDPEEWPPEMKEVQYAKFHDWLIDRYTDPENPSETEEQIANRIVTEVWGNRNLPEDDIPNGQFQLEDAWTIAWRLNPRYADQIRYFVAMQESLWADASQVIRDSGYSGTISATNWKTAKDELLLDLELKTYTIAGVVDVHSYFSPIARDSAVSWRHTSGDEMAFLPMVAVPQRNVMGNKAIEGYPLTVSETTWTSVSGVTQEAPLLVAAYTALSDVDGWVWFAQDSVRWHNELRMWPIAYPNMLGQFPAATLLYREGYITEAPVVVREGRLVDTILSRQEAALTPFRGFDPTRDSSTNWNWNPDSGTGEINPLAFLAGRTEVAFDTDDDYITPGLQQKLNSDAESYFVESITGELMTNWETGLTTINADRAQGIVGFLERAGPVDLKDISINSTMNFAAVIAVPLDGAPIRESERLLIQAAGHNTTNGFSSSTVSMDWKRNPYTGLRLLTLGGMPWRMERIEAEVTIPGVGSRVQSITMLDEDGYHQANVSIQTVGDDLVLKLPASSMYTIVELNPADDKSPSIQPTQLPVGDLGQEYTAQLVALGGDGELTWSLDSIPLLPNGISWDAANGTLSGTPMEGYRNNLTFTVTDADGDSDTVSFPLFIRPIPEAPIFGEPSNEVKETEFGFIWDAPYPFVYMFSPANFAWIVPGSTPESTFLYVYGDPGFWAWTAIGIQGYYYQFDGDAVGWHQW